MHAARLVVSGCVMERKENRLHPFERAWVVMNARGAIHRELGWTNPRDYCQPIIRSESSGVSCIRVSSRGARNRANVQRQRRRYLIANAKSNINSSINNTNDVHCAYLIQYIARFASPVNKLVCMYIYIYIYIICAEVHACFVGYLIFMTLASIIGRNNSSVILKC